MRPIELTLDALETYGQHGTIAIRVQIRVHAAATPLIDPPLALCLAAPGCFANDPREVADGRATQIFAGTETRDEAKIMRRPLTHAVPSASRRRLGLAAFLWIRCFFGAPLARAVVGVLEHRVPTGRLARKSWRPDDVRDNREKKGL
jgi:hypothetical protein